MDSFLVLREKREEKKLTVTAAAKDLGISISMLSKLENGKTAITQKIADKLNNYYGINIAPQSLKVVYDGQAPIKVSKYKIMFEELKEENRSLKKEIERLTDELEQKNKIVECIKLAIDGEGTLLIRRNKKEE